MITMTLAQAANILGLSGSFKEITFQGLSIDTRTLKPGNLFIALPGSRVNGHDFIMTAKEKGAACAMTTQAIQTDFPQLIVKDNVSALGKLGAAWRDQFQIPFIAATGSNGKTTLKNMMAAILIAACQHDEQKVLATIGTLNNDLGLPLTLARLNAQHRYAVLEMGMNHFGEINYLTKMTRPNVAVITNAAASHLAGVRDIAGVARAKSEIFAGMPADGTAILNRDDAFYPYWREQIGNRQYLSFGFHPDADIKAEVLQIAETQRLRLKTPQGEIEINLPLLGQHNILNTLAASAATLALQIDLTAIKAGIESIQPAPGRLQLHKLANDVNVIDDTYNANPFSLKAALETLARFHGKKILVLGDMKELGDEEVNLHHIAGVEIRKAGIDYLFTYGKLSETTAIAFGEGAYHFNEQEKLVTALRPFLYSHTTILIKGSRSMRMERVVQGLMS